MFCVFVDQQLYTGVAQLANESANESTNESYCSSKRSGNSDSSVIVVFCYC